MPLENQYMATPGVKQDYVAPIREVLMREPLTEHFFPLGFVVDGSKSRDPGNSGDRVDILRAGLLMGKVTASGKYATSILGVLQAALTSAGTNIVVDSPDVATEIIRRLGASGTFKLTGPEAASGTVRTKTVTYSAVGSGSGANEVQTISWSVTPTGGTFTITATKADGSVVTTAPIAYGATCSTTVANALIAILGTAAVSVAATSSTTADNGFAITFSGTGYAALNQPAVAVDTTLLTSATVTPVVTVTETTRGYAAAQNVTITAVGVNEVQTVSFNISSTGGNVVIEYTDPTTGARSRTAPAAWSATDATYLGAIQSALDTATGVANGIVVSAISATDTDLGFKLTFSGTGYAAKTHPLVTITTLPTSSTSHSVARTVTGVDGRFAAGSLIQPVDGSETPVTIFADKFGAKVTDYRLTSIDKQYPGVLLQGMVRTSMVVNYPTDTSLIAWLKASLRTPGGHWIFDDDFLTTSY
jgi:hypothetical protein